MQPLAPLRAAVAAAEVCAERLEDALAAARVGPEPSVSVGPWYEGCPGFGLLFTPKRAPAIEYWRGRLKVANDAMAALQKVQL